MRRVWPESNSATSFNRCKTRCGSRSIARSGHPEEVENGSFQRGGEYCACALSGPCRAVVLCASQNDLPDDAPGQCKCGRTAKRAIGNLHGVLGVRTPLCIRLDHDAHRQAAGCLGRDTCASACPGRSEQERRGEGNLRARLRNRAATEKAGLLPICASGILRFTKTASATSP